MNTATQLQPQVAQLEVQPRICKPVVPVTFEAAGLTNLSAAAVLRRMADYLEMTPQMLPDGVQFYASPQSDQYVGVIYETE